MRIKILLPAVEDLHDGRIFYQKQGEDMGEYFFDSLFADIDSLILRLAAATRSDYCGSMIIEQITLEARLNTRRHSAMVHQTQQKILTGGHSK